MVVRPMEWYFEVTEKKLFKRMAAWEERELDKALAMGKSTVEYKWTFEPAELAGDKGPRGTEYKLDLTAMTQTIQETKKVRRLLRIPAASSSREPPSSKKQKCDATTTDEPEQQAETSTGGTIERCDAPEDQSNDAPEDQSFWAVL